MTSNDTLPGVPGPRPWPQRLMARHIARLHAAAAHDERLATAFVRVSGRVDEPPALLGTRVLVRVLRGSPSATLGARP